MVEKGLPKILFISSANPLLGSGAIGLRIYQHMKDSGMDVDMLTLTKVEGYPEILYVKRSFWGRLKSFIKRKYWLLLGKVPGNNMYRPYYFFYEKENQPPIPTKDVLRCIKKRYDLVIVYFWQYLLSFDTIEAIYDKIHPIVFFFPPDYSHMSGGCHFPGECSRFQSGCGFCPAINSHDENDFTRWNVSFRERVYQKVHPIVFGNSYMMSFYKKSYLLKGVRTVKSVPVINTKDFYPMDKVKLRNDYAIPSEAKFIIGFGCQRLSDPRKGFSVLIAALNNWYDQLNESERNLIHVVTAGNEFENVKNSIPFSSTGLGMLNVKDLPKFYSLLDVFICPSVNDAGPSMVAQSIACGTPVVGFEMGALLDLVKDCGTGICVEIGNSLLLSEAIDKFFKMSKPDYDSYVQRCLTFAKSANSDRRLVQWLDIYQDEKVKKDQGI